MFPVPKAVPPLGAAHQLSVPDWVDEPLSATVPEPHLEFPAAVTTGVVRTVPETAIFWVVAFVDVRVTFPLGLPEAPLDVRTYTVVEPMDPPDCATVLVLAYVLLSKETSNPVGAVMVALAVRFAPVNVND